MNKIGGNDLETTKKRILVACVSKYGATREIAEKAAEVLRQSGLSVDVSPASGAAEAASYDAVLFGSAVYFGAWRRKAVAFLQEWGKLPAAPPLWLFFSGPTGDVDPEAQAMGGKGIPERRRQLIEQIKPRGIAFFRGKLDEARLNGLEKWAIRKANAQLGDFRDWGAITSWAEATVNEIRRQS
jgi:menaquinone-dependent protoporphyrinogen oxidase